MLRGRGLPESVSVRPVTANFFEVLGRRAAVGQSFGSWRDAVLLSDACWRRLFNADPQIVGTVVTLDDRPHVIAGVTAAERLEFINDSDLFSVLDVRPVATTEHDSAPLNVIARLQPGVSVPTAEAAARTTVERADHGRAPASREGVRVQTLRDAYTGWNRRPVLFFLAAAAFVLLLSCANVANLLLARSLARQREFAIRAALGGGRGALIRLLVVEGSVISVIAGTGALLATTWALKGLSSWLPEDYLDRSDQLVLDGRAFAFALLATAATGLVFGLTPALFAARTDVQPMLAQGGRSVGGSREQRHARHALVVFEIVIALVLVFGAGLFLNSFVRLTNLPLGFDPRGRVTMRMPITGARYADPHEVVALATRLLENVRAIPGVIDAAAGTSVPLTGASSVRFVVADQPRPAPGDEPKAIVRAVSPGFHRSLAVRRLAGRDFTDDDDEAAPRVAVINERLARRLFAGRDPLGQRLTILRPGDSWVRPGTVQIVGVVSDMKEVGLNEVEFNDISLPLAQHPPTSLQIVATTSLPLASIVDPLRRAAGQVDPNLPVSGISAMPDLVDNARRGDRFNLLLIASFAIVAILMAGVGIYGAMSYAVAQRTQELGVRLALGARPGRILGLAIGEALRMGMMGTALGLLSVLVLARALGSALYLVPAQHNGLLYGVTTTDPVTLASAGAGVMIIAAAAGLVPARRAARVDPIQALRCE